MFTTCPPTHQVLSQFHLFFSFLVAPEQVVVAAMVEQPPILLLALEGEIFGAANLNPAYKCFSSPSDTLQYLSQLESVARKLKDQLIRQNQVISRPKMFWA